jgi:hypothetical protein
MDFFRSLPTAVITVEMDASDVGLCAIVSSAKVALTYSFNAIEQQLIQQSKTVPSTGFDINYRELLSCAFTVHTWGPLRAARGGTTPLHAHFRIDNASAVSW